MTGHTKTTDFHLTWIQTNPLHLQKQSLLVYLCNKSKASWTEPQSPLRVFWGTHFQPFLCCWHQKISKPPSPSCLWLALAAATSNPVLQVSSRCLMSGISQRSPGRLHWQWLCVFEWLVEEVGMGASVAWLEGRWSTCRADFSSCLIDRTLRSCLYNQPWITGSEVDEWSFLHILW